MVCTQGILLQQRGSASVLGHCHHLYVLCDAICWGWLCSDLRQSENYSVEPYTEFWVGTRRTDGRVGDEELVCYSWWKSFFLPKPLNAVYLAQRFSANRTSHVLDSLQVNSISQHSQAFRAWLVLYFPSLVS